MTDVSRSIGATSSPTAPGSAGRRAASPWSTAEQMARDRASPGWRRRRRSSRSSRGRWRDFETVPQPVRPHHGGGAPCDGQDAIAGAGPGGHRARRDGRSRAEEKFPSARDAIAQGRVDGTQSSSYCVMNGWFVNCVVEGPNWLLRNTFWVPEVVLLVGAEAHQEGGIHRRAGIAAVLVDRRAQGRPVEIRHGDGVGGELALDRDAGRPRTLDPLEVVAEEVPDHPSREHGGGGGATISTSWRDTTGPFRGRGTNGALLGHSSAFRLPQGVFRKGRRRVSQTTPTNDAMPVLMSLGITSAYDSMGHSETALETLYWAGSRKQEDRVSKGRFGPHAFHQLPSLVTAGPTRSHGRHA
jgi:hypothetical protein